MVFVLILSLTLKLDIIPYCAESSPLVDTVVKLLGNYADKGHHLYMDTFYNSVKLCYELLKMKTHVCGTLRQNRGEPQDRVCNSFHFG